MKVRTLAALMVTIAGLVLGTARMAPGQPPAQVQAEAPPAAEATGGTASPMYSIEYRPNDTSPWQLYSTTRSQPRADQLATELRDVGYQAQVSNASPIPAPLEDASEYRYSYATPTTSWANDYNYYMVPGGNYSYGWYGGWNPGWWHSFYPWYGWNNGRYYHNAWYRGHGWHSGHRGWHYASHEHHTHDSHSHRHATNEHHQSHAHHNTAGHHTPGHNAAAAHATRQSHDHRGTGHQPTGRRTGGRNPQARGHQPAGHHAGPAGGAAGRRGGVAGGRAHAHTAGHHAAGHNRARHGRC